MPFFYPVVRHSQNYSEPVILPPAMIRNYLKIAWRNLIHNKSYAVINVSGLALGISSGILIFTLVNYHLSFDDFHPHADRIYRFVTDSHRETISYEANVPSPLGKVFRNDCPFGEKTARIATFNNSLITVKDGRNIFKFKEKEGIAFTESEFFDIFHYPLREGNKTTALTEPNTAILTERMAGKIFGATNPINKTFRLNNSIDFRVTGILRNLPPNTDRQTEIYVSYPTLKQYNKWLASDDDAWQGISDAMQCFVRLQPGVSPAQVEKVLQTYAEKYRPNSRYIHHYKLQSLADIHFNPRYKGKMPKVILWILASIGVFLVITACLNFINLATAQALKRSKEIGVRKVLGSVRGQLFWQFIAETALITMTAFILALIGALLAVPWVNQLFRINITVNPFADRQLPTFMVLLAVFVTFFAGAYPGLVLARFQPLLALKGRLSQQNTGGFTTRRGLIIVQFVISQLLIFGVIVVVRQMNYVTESELSFSKEAVVLLPVASRPEIRNTLKEHLSKLAHVKQVSLCRTPPTSENNWENAFRFDNRSEDENFGISMKAADEEYIPLFGLTLVAGRNLAASDTVREFVVNETLAKNLNLTASDQLIGKMLSMNDGELKGPIVGVVRDFHDRSFRETISAVCLMTYGNDYHSYAIKIDMVAIKTTLASLEKVWSELHPDQVFEYQFLEEQIAELYLTETFMLRLIQIFGAIAIFIGCLGLYGLVSFMSARKTKEIGVRKVLGSSSGQIVWIFTKEFSRLILIAFMLAAPGAWYMMSAWLQFFHYRIDPDADIFLLTIAGSFLIAGLTVGYQTIKAASMNPVKSLRAE